MPSDSPVVRALDGVLCELVKVRRLAAGEVRRHAQTHGVQPSALLDAIAQHGVVVDDDGICLADGLELLCESEIRSRLSRRASVWVRELQIRVLTDSTNTRLMDIAARRGIDGAVCLAEAQTAGRGRRGRQWHGAFARNIALSMGIRMLMPAADLGPLSLVVGLAVVDALAVDGMPALALKWPNDVLLDGRKLGGILIELARADERSSELVIGVGLNLASTHAMASNVEQPFATVAETGVSMGRNALVARLINAIHAFAGRFGTDGFEPMRRAWERYNAHQGRPVTVIAGEESRRGRMVGVDARGALLLETAAGVIALTGGEISLRADPDAGCP